MDKKTDFKGNLLVIFRGEAEEHIGTLSAGLVALEQTPASAKQTELVEEIFRAAHSLKGAARAVNLMEVESLCHAIENIFSSIKTHQLIFTPSLFDVLHNTVDMIGQLSQQTVVGESEHEKTVLKELLQQLNHILTNKDVISDTPSSKKAPQSVSQTSVEVIPDKLISQDVVPEKTQPQNTLHKTPHEKKVKISDTIKISATKLDKLLLHTEELLSVKLIASECVATIREALNEMSTLKKTQTKAEPIRKKLQQTLTNTRTNLRSRASDMQFSKILDLIEWEASFVKSFESKLTTLAKSAEQNQYALSHMVDGLLDEIKNILMLPISATLESFPKLVRDIAHDQGKKIELVIRGAETEIDRRILDEMYDPLIHLMRNCIDHGIEAPDVRKRHNKPLHGTVTIAINQKDGGHIEILVSDDGAGIDIKKIHDKAYQLGLTSKNAGNEQESLSLIFQSGVSTNPMVTDLSGRGLGLAIVWEKIEKLGGVVSVETRSGEGTMFRITLPLTLATFRGVYIRVREQLFIFPTVQIEQCLRMKATATKSVENKDTILWREEVVPLVKLADILELPRKPIASKTEDAVHLIIIGIEGKHIACCVDEILSEEDILVKSFNKQLSRVRNIMGATVLGNGKAVPILNVIDLLRSADKNTLKTQSLTLQHHAAEKKVKSILVVEDSITSRTLLKNILESAGYKVSTAVDGLDGFMRLQTEAFDLVMSDVSMPKMNGFDLTTKIRADKLHANLPVILVTSLESPEDRERGIEAGADAYILKRYFDETNLLDLVRRLI